MSPVSLMPKAVCEAVVPLTGGRVAGLPPTVSNAFPVENPPTTVSESLTPLAIARGSPAEFSRLKSPFVPRVKFVNRMGVASLSEFHLARMFRASFGLPPAAWIAQQRLERARALLRSTALPLAQIAEQCGYANASHFSHRFRESVGVAPTVFRQVVGV